MLAFHILFSFNYLWVLFIYSKKVVDIKLSNNYIASSPTILQQ